MPIATRLQFESVEACRRRHLASRPTFDQFFVFVCLFLCMLMSLIAFFLFVSLSVVESVCYERRHLHIGDAGEGQLQVSRGRLISRRFGRLQGKGNVAVSEGKVAR